MFATWLLGGKTLELPEPKYLYIKKMGKFKIFLDFVIK
jgi:hypothetical protein